MRGSHTSPVPSVYPSREDTQLLGGVAGSVARGRVLDIGTGQGEVARAAARPGTVVVATDLNPEALRRLLGAAWADGAKIHPVRTDLASGLRRFDVILANPPYLPTRPGEGDPDRWTDLALNGGPDGCGTWARIIDLLPEHLAERGRAFVLESSRQDPARRESIRERWRADGGGCEEFARRRLEGETLRVYEWTRSAGASRARPDRA